MAVSVKQRRLATPPLTPSDEERDPLAFTLEDPPRDHNTAKARVRQTLRPRQILHSFAPIRRLLRETGTSVLRLVPLT